MNIFDYIKNEAFFKPLTSKHRRIYYACIQILIEKSKELPVLYETDARDCLTVYLRNLGIESEAETGDENGEEQKEAELQAPAILAWFRECGWLGAREIGRNGEYVVHISTDCRRIMDFLRKLTEKAGEGTMSNRIFSMYEIVKSASEEDSVRRERPYSNLLIPLLDDEAELKNELTDLKDSISNIMKTVIAFQDMNSFGQYIMKDEMLDRFFSEYFFVKNNGLIPMQISFIRGRLRELCSGDIYEKMVTECAEKLQISMEAAKERVGHIVSELQYFLASEYEEHMELIDKRINNYYNLANTRILLMASNELRLEAVLNRFLNQTAKLPAGEQERAFARVADCAQIVNQKYVGYKSFEKTERLKAEGQNIGLTQSELSEEEKAERTDALFTEAPNRYSVARVSAYLEEKLEQDACFSLKGKRLAAREDALMFAAAMIYAGNEEFPFAMQLSEEEVDTGVARINQVTITKR